ncbi:MAG: [LysW]-lysine hydrolase [Anaerolineales bacterium]
MEAPKTLLGLLERYSPSGKEQEAVSWLVARMRELGFTQAYPDGAGNAVGRMGKGAKQIVLLGHIDTVTGNIEVRLEGDDLYGRGSVDAKGPLAAFVDAVSQVGVNPEWEIIVVGAVDEEGDSKGARHIINQYHPQFAIVGEPSHWQKITLGYKGTAWAQVRMSQGITHTAANHASICEEAFAAWQRILDWCHDYNQGKERQFDQITPTLRGFHSFEDGLQEYAELRIGTRLPEGVTPEKWYQNLHGILNNDHAIYVEMERIGYPIPAYRSEKNGPLVRHFLQSIRAQGGEPSFALKTGTADMNIVAPHWNCPIVAYGPGDSSLDHTPNEHLSLAEYEKAVQVLVSVLNSLISVTSH